MKHALRYIGVGLFLAGVILFSLNHFNFLAEAPQTTQVTSSAPTTTTPKNNTPVAVTNQTTQVTSTTTAQTVAQTQPSGTNGTIAIVVDDHSTSYSVAQDLFDAGIITDMEAFNQYMEANDLSRYVQSGTFTLRKGMTLQELGDVLTTYPGN